MYRFSKISLYDFLPLYTARSLKCIECIDFFQNHIYKIKIYICYKVINNCWKLYTVEKMLKNPSEKFFILTFSNKIYTIYSKKEKPLYKEGLACIDFYIFLKIIYSKIYTRVSATNFKENSTSIKQRKIAIFEVRTTIFTTLLLCIDFF